jgi:hypothetical protein
MLESPLPAIAGIAIMTAGRHALLQRSLDSYVAQMTACRPGLEFIVFDDSKDGGERRASFEVAQAARQRFGVCLRFAGFDERSQYLTRLQECSAVPKEILEYALLEPAGYTLGQNRNALLLDTVGSLYFSADDDTVCAPVLPQQQIDTCLAVSVDSDPSQYWCFADFADARTRVCFVDIDFLAAHEQLLGRSVQQLDSAMTAASDPSRQQTFALGRCPMSPGNQVRITMNGLLGDCGWGAPFGLWHEAMGYLAFRGSSLERLTVSENHYRETTLSRQMLRVSAGPVLSDLSFSMLTFWGFDNRELLPPNLPSHRGQDLIFGQTLWRCFDTAIAGHIPLALVHDPVPPRRFWRGEMQRSAVGIDLCRLVIEVIKLCQWNDAGSTPQRRLQILGEHFKQLAELPTAALAASITERLYESNRLLEHTLSERARALVERAPYYTEDVNRYMAALKEAQRREQYWLPLDLFLPGGAAQAEKRVRNILMKFGALLGYWPVIVEAAKLLRQDGVRLSSRI